MSYSSLTAEINPGLLYEVKISIRTALELVVEQSGWGLGLGVWTFVLPWQNPCTHGKHLGQEFVLYTKCFEGKLVGTNFAHLVPLFSCSAMHWVPSPSHWGEGNATFSKVVWPPWKKKKRRANVPCMLSLAYWASGRWLLTAGTDRGLGQQRVYPTRTLACLKIHTKKQNKRWHMHTGAKPAFETKTMFCVYRAAHRCNRHCQCSCQVHLLLRYKCIVHTNAICDVLQVFSIEMLG